MTIYQYFDPSKPRFHDAAFYNDRPVSDHIHEPVHRERLLRSVSDVRFVMDMDKESLTVSDIGCGNGGLLKELDLPPENAWGYDLSPKAVLDGREKYNLSLYNKDFVNEKIEIGDIVVMTEVLEHLVDPVAFLRNLRGKSRWIVSSCPAFENEKEHYEFHLWAWDPLSYGHMFRKLGYEVILHYVFESVGTQFIIARNPK